MSSKTTTLIRVPRQLAKELRTKFPNVESSRLIQIMYDTSLLKLESGLRKVNATKKK